MRAGRNKRHSFASLLVLILIAVSARFNTVRGIATYLKEIESLLAKHMHLPHVVPGEWTYRSVLERTDTVKLEQVMFGGTAEFDVGEILSMPWDGKIIRGILGKGDDPDGLLTLFLVGPNQSIVAIPL